MQTSVLKHVQVFVVNYFWDFPDFFWIEGWVGEANCIQTFFGFLDFFYIYKVPKWLPVA